jgi:hypothetical protein
VTAAVADLEALEHTFIGPSWTRGPLGNYLTPEDLGLKTLGWQIAAWCTKYLNGLDGGRWQFTNEQFRLLLWWYAVDENGRFAYRKGVLQRLKGWGKDPFAELALNCGFDEISITPHGDDDFPGFRVLIELPQEAFFAEVLAALNKQLQDMQVPSAPVPR